MLNVALEIVHHCMILHNGRQSIFVCRWAITSLNHGIDLYRCWTASLKQPACQPTC